MSGNDERVADIIITEQPQRMMRIGLGDRLFAIFELWLVSLVLWFMGVIIFNYGGSVLFMLPYTSYVSNEIVILVFLYITLIFFLGFSRVFIKHYGVGRVYSVFKIPFTALKDTILVATGKKSTTEVFEPEFDIWY